MSAKHEKLAERLAGILIELNTHGQVNPKKLAEQFAVSTRTIQKDLNERLAFLQWEQCDRNSYKINQSQLGIFKQEDIARFARFASVQNLFPKIDRSFFQKNLTDSIQVKGLPYEDVRNLGGNFDQLQQAIENHQLIEFHYIKKGHIEQNRRVVEPYALLNKSGVWYLIGIENGKEKTFTFTQIKTIIIKDETFVPDEKLRQAIQQNDSISHGNQMNEVIIKVSADVASYFKHRHLLPNQELVRELDSGELLLSCKNIHELEIIPTVQYWIPHLTVISPVELQERMKEKLRLYLENN